VLSTDELIGAQELERKHPGLPSAPGKVERHEFEYILHGTQSLVIDFNVASGQVVPPSCGDTCTEADFGYGTGVCTLSREQKPAFFDNQSGVKTKNRVS
jgi:hypothetical protein